MSYFVMNVFQSLVTNILYRAALVSSIMLNNYKHYTFFSVSHMKHNIKKLSILIIFLGIVVYTLFLRKIAAEVRIISLIFKFFFNFKFF